MLEARRNEEPPSTFNVDPLIVVDKGPLTEENNSLTKSLQNFDAQNQKTHTRCNYVYSKKYTSYIKVASARLSSKIIIQFTVKLMIQIAFKYHHL